MKKNTAVLLVLMAIFGISTAFAYVPPEVRIDGKDIVITKMVEVGRFQNVFDFSVEPNEIPGKIALALVRGELPEYVSNDQKRTLKKIYHRHFPLKTEFEVTATRYFLDSTSGKISRGEYTSSDISYDLRLEIFLRGLVIIGIFAVSFAAPRSSRLLLFYAAIFASVITGAAVNKFFGNFHALISVQLVAVCIIALAAYFSTKGSGFMEVPFLFGMLSGLCVNMFPDTPYGKLGWENAGTNDYLIFLGFVCMMFFLASRMARGRLQRK